MTTALTLIGMVLGVGIAFGLIYLDSLRRLRKVTGKSIRRQLAEDLHVRSTR